jgi:phage-related protein
MRASMPLSVVFFKTNSGSEPVRNWLREDLTSAQRAIIGRDLKVVQFMWPVGMPLVRPMGDGLWELRSVLEDTIARILFAFYQNQIVLLTGFIKKTGKTPQNQLALAKQRKAAFRKG